MSGRDQESPSRSAAVGRKRTSKAAKRSTAIAAAPEPFPISPSIHAATVQAHDRMRARRTRVQVKVRQTGPNTFVHEAANGFHPDMTTMQVGDALGTTSKDFSDRIMSQIATAFGDTPEHSQRGINTALATLDGMKPENEVEAMLVAQMIVSHDAAMNCITQIGKGAIEQTEVFGSLAVKLMRTYTAQVEAMAKLRRKGEQTVKVVHVYPGGQAVVGDVHNHAPEGGANLKPKDQPDATRESAESTALPGTNPIGNTVQLPGNAERKMSHARRPISGRTKG